MPKLPNLLANQIIEIFSLYKRLTLSLIIFLIGRVLKGSVLKPALNYDDPDLLRILKLDKLGMMSFHQVCC